MVNSCLRGDANMAPTAQDSKARSTVVANPSLTGGATTAPNLPQDSDFHERRPVSAIKQGGWENETSPEEQGAVADATERGGTEQMMRQGVNVGFEDAASGNRGSAALGRRLSDHEEDPIRNRTARGLVEEDTVEMGIAEPIFSGEPIDETEYLYRTYTAPGCESHVKIPKKKKTIQDLMNELKDINEELLAKYPLGSTDNEQKQGKGRVEGSKSHYDIWKSLMIQRLKSEYRFRSYSGAKDRPNLRWACNIWEHVTSAEQEPFRQLAEEDKIKSTIQRRAGKDFDQNLGLRFNYLLGRAAKELSLGQAAMEPEKYKPATIYLKGAGKLVRTHAGGEENTGSEGLKANGATQESVVAPKSAQPLIPRAGSKDQMAPRSSPSQLNPTMATTLSDLVSTNPRLQNHTEFVSHPLQLKDDVAPAICGPVAASPKSTSHTTSHPKVPHFAVATPDNQLYINLALRPSKRRLSTLSDKRNEPPQKLHRSSRHSDHLTTTTTTTAAAANNYRAAISSQSLSEAVPANPINYRISYRLRRTHKFHAAMSAQDNMSGADHATGDNKGDNKGDKNNKNPKNDKNGKGNKNKQDSKNHKAPLSKSGRRISKSASERHQKRLRRSDSELADEILFSSLYPHRLQKTTKFTSSSTKAPPASQPIPYLGDATHDTHSSLSYLPLRGRFTPLPTSAPPATTSRYGTRDPMTSSADRNYYNGPDPYSVIIQTFFRPHGTFVLRWGSGDGDNDDDDEEDEDYEEDEEDDDEDEDEDYEDDNEVEDRLM